MLSFSTKLLLSLATALLWTLRSAEGCSCLGPITLEDSFANAQTILTAYLYQQTQCPDDGFNNVCYWAWLWQVDKGCEPRGQWFYVRTDQTSCQVYLDPHNWYVLSGIIDGDRNFVPGACSFNSKWGDLTYEDHQLLQNAPPPTCNVGGGGGPCPDGSHPVQCFDDPCNTAIECNDPEAECVANYCGGCNYNYYINGNEAHEICTSCNEAHGDDCPYHQYCSKAGTCLRTCACSDDSDCEDPDNMCNYPYCVGPISCEDSVCVKRCS